MDMKYYIVNAFVGDGLLGNPACVFLLEKKLSEQEMQEIATKMNVAASAFILREMDKYYLWWFNPGRQIPLCGHGSIAAASIFFSFVDSSACEFSFTTKYHGELTAYKNGDRYSLSFPKFIASEFDQKSYLESLTPTRITSHIIDVFETDRIVIIVDDEELVDSITKEECAELGYNKPVVVSAKSKGKYDFVSRVFYFSHGLVEDAVTGSAHCSLGPYWAEKLGKKSLLAHQASKRGGEVFIEVKEDSVGLSGKVEIEKEGTLTI